MKKNNLPRISLNSLSEYLISQSSKRKQILIEQFDPKVFQVGYYYNATKFIQKYLIGRFNKETLLEGVKFINNIKPKSHFENQKNKNNIAALSYFRNINTQILPLGCTFVEGKNNCSKIIYSNVEISVRPEIVLHKEEKSTGLIKLYFSKEKPLTEISSKYLTTVLYDYCSNYLCTGSNIDYEQCIVIDVFSTSVYKSPKFIKKIRDDIIAGCEEINLRWKDNKNIN